MTQIVNTTRSPHNTPTLVDLLLMFLAVLLAENLGAFNGFGRKMECFNVDNYVILVAILIYWTNIFSISLAAARTFSEGYIRFTKTKWDIFFVIWGLIACYLSIDWLSTSGWFTSWAESYLKDKQVAWAVYYLFPGVIFAGWDIFLSFRLKGDGEKDSDFVKNWLYADLILAVCMVIILLVPLTSDSPPSTHIWIAISGTFIIVLSNLILNSEFYLHPIQKESTS